MKRLLSISIAILFCLTSRASHIVGGEFNIVYLQKGFNYSLELNVYFDEVNATSIGLIDDSFIAFIYDKQTNLKVDEFLLPLRSDQEFVPYIIPDCQINELQTRILRYRQTIALPPDVYNNTDGYYIVVDRCCRNDIIANISDPGETGMMFYMEIPPVIKNGVPFNDNSPDFVEPFAEYACVGQDFVYDFSANDPDGDSLVYYMTDPFNGNFGLPYSDPVPEPHAAPYASVDWLLGFSANNAVPGAPTMNIDSRTGILSVTPTTQGLYVFSVIVEEYRDGQQIGLVKRDYQLLVRPPCDPNFPPTVLFYDDGSSVPYDPVTDTIFINSSDPRTFDIAITDTIIGGKLSIVTLNTEPVGGNPSLYSLGNRTAAINFNGDTTFTQMVWDDCADSEGDTWSIQLLATDNGCTIPMSDTLVVHFVVEPVDNQDPFVYTSLTEDTIEIKVNNDTSFTVFGEDNDGDLITLSGNGVGFNLQGAGMQFPSVSGTGMVNSTFSWSPGCQHLSREYFPVEFTVDDQWCGAPNDSTVSVVIRVFEEPANALPFTPINVFTPNGDGFNDYFEMPDLPEERCGNEFLSVEVYNRWGASVFRDTNIGFKWAGGDLVSGTYYYHINYEDRSFTGWVQLLR